MKTVKKATIRAVHEGWLIEGLNFCVSSLSTKGVVLKVLDLIEFANAEKIQILNKSHLLKIHSDQLKY